MRYGSVYIATNLKTGEQYVGQTRQRAAVRFYAHMLSARKIAGKYTLREVYHPV